MGPKLNLTDLHKKCVTHEADSRKIKTEIEKLRNERAVLDVKISRRETELFDVQKEWERDSDLFLIARLHVSGASFLRRRARELKRGSFSEELQKLCGHQLILEYDGRDTGDVEDRYPGKRYCALCGQSETEYELTETRRRTTYTQLCSREDRLIKRDYQGSVPPWGEHRRSVLEPFPAIRLAFIEAAGNVNGRLNIKWTPSKPWSAQRW